MTSTAGHRCGNGSVRIHGSCAGSIAAAAVYVVVTVVVVDVVVVACVERVKVTT